MHVTLEREGRVIWSGDVQYPGHTILRPLAYRSGIFIEHYPITEATDRGFRANFSHLERSRKLYIHPRPERLPN